MGCTLHGLHRKGRCNQYKRGEDRAADDGCYDSPPPIPTGGCPKPARSSTFTQWLINQWSRQHLVSPADVLVSPADVAAALLVKLWASHLFGLGAQLAVPTFFCSPTLSRVNTIIALTLP